MSRRLRTIELLTAADLAKSDLARAQENAASEIANTNRWIGALSGLVKTGTDLASTAYGNAKADALNEAKTFASQHANVASVDDVNAAIAADPSMQAPKATGNWADDFIANPFGVKGALANAKRNAATQALSDTAVKNKARIDELARVEKARADALAREDKLLADKNARDDKIRADDLAIADRRRGEDAEMRAFEFERNAAERAKDRASNAADRAAERTSRVQAAQAEANARAAQRADDKAAAQAQRDAEYQRDLTDKQKQKVVEVENFRTNIKDNIALLKKQIDDTGTYEMFGPESADMERRITAIATDMAKLADPGSVAREGEVATAKKGLFPTGVGALFTSNSTAQQVLDNLAAEVDRRAANAYRIRGLPSPSSTTSAPTAAPAPTPASDPMMLVVYSDGTTQQVRRSALPSKLPSGVTVTEKR